MSKLKHNTKRYQIDLGNKHYIVTTENDIVVVCPMEMYIGYSIHDLTNVIKKRNGKITYLGE